MRKEIKVVTVWHGPKPSEIDLSGNFRSTLGCVEFEEAAIRIVKHLATNEPVQVDWPDTMMSGAGKDDQRVDCWGQAFRIDSIPGIDPTMFAMLCSAGWIEHIWFPKGSFCVSEAFIDRVVEKWTKKAEPIHA